MRYLFALLVLASLLSSPALSQVVFEGTVTTAPDDHPAESATVRADPVGLMATVAPDGRYRLVIPDGALSRDSISLIVQLNGYAGASRSLRVRPGERRTEVFRLHPGTAAVVSGRVTNLRGQPEAAVMVRIEALAAGATTGADGSYRLVVPPTRILPGQAVRITASRVGLSGVSRDVALFPGAALSQDFQVAPSVVVLNDVVVTGTADVRVREAPAATTALQGRVAGVTLDRPAASASILLRGPESLSGSAGEPLYIVDGVILGAGIEALDASDIESIEVLRSSSAAAIYGARAAGGAIQITTRRGAVSRYTIGARGGALRWTSDFTWPPPRWTARHDLPAGLVEGSGRTLGGVFSSLHDALVRAGYDEWAVYELGADGFVVVGRREVIGESGEPVPPRWNPDEQVSWGEYFRALFYASPGRYRIIAFVVSPRRLVSGGEVEKDVLERYVVEGARMLPPDHSGRPLAPGTQYTALIYEFYRPTEDSPIRLVTRSRISSVEHLAHAQLWTRQELLGPGGRQ